MTELALYQGGTASSGKTVSRENPLRYKVYDWYYENPPELFHNVRYGRSVGEVTRQEYFHPEELLKKEVKPLRNPIHRVVEFYATTMLTGTAKEAFPFKETKDAVRDAVLTKWTDSNMDALKQRIKRLTAKHGLSFGKACMPQDDSPVHGQEIKACHVTDYTKDPRGHIDYIRLDIPVEPTAEDEADPSRAGKKWTVTEVWRKGKRERQKDGSYKKTPGYFKQWQRERDSSPTSVVAESDLGPAKISYVLSEEKSDKSLGFDFVPFVDFVAMDDGERWPKPVWHHAIPLFEEAMRMATRYSELLFIYNKPHRAVVGIGNDAGGRPYPPPEVPGQRASSLAMDEDSVRFKGFLATLVENSGADETLDGDIWFGTPGNARIDDVTPNIEFEAQRRALADTLEELKQELPELGYYDTDRNVPDSSRAERLRIQPAIERTREMQSNIENALIKWDKMLLTMAQLKGEDGFSEGDIGTFENGEGFEHSFEQTEIVETAEVEKQEVLGRQIANMIALIQLGYSQQQAAEQVGLSKLAFAENAPESPGVDPEAMSVGTGGNPGGGTNFEGAAQRVQRNLTGPQF